jgi:hypothetical protein
MTSDKCARIWPISVEVFKERDCWIVLDTSSKILGYSGSAKEMRPPASILSKMKVSFGFIQLGFGFETYGKFGSDAIIFLSPSLEKLVKQNPKWRACNHYGNKTYLFSRRE